MSTPVVSIVLPLHNAESYLDRSLSQLRSLSQSRADYQIVVIEDHSSDRTAALIESWPSQISGEVVLLKATERGVSHARNQALESCTGEYVWFVDADDVWDESILTVMVEIGDRDRSDLVICNAVKITPDGDKRGSIDDALVVEQTTGKEAFMRLLEGRLQGHLWNKLIRKSALQLAPFPDQRANSDLGGMLKLTARCDVVSYEPRALYSYIQNPGSILNSKEFEWGNLVNCLRIAQAEAKSYGTDPRAKRALLRFQYFNVVLPIASELARRTESMSKDLLTLAVADLRAQIRKKDIVNLAIAGSIVPAARIALLSLSPRTYMALYRRARGNTGTTPS